MLSSPRRRLSPWMRASLVRVLLILVFLFSRSRSTPPRPQKGFFSLNTSDDGHETKLRERRERDNTSDNNENALFLSKSSSKARRFFILSRRKRRRDSFQSHTRLYVPFFSLSNSPPRERFHARALPLSLEKEKKTKKTCRGKKSQPLLVVRCWLRVYMIREVRARVCVCARAEHNRVVKREDEK